MSAPTTAPAPTLPHAPRHAPEWVGRAAPMLVAGLVAIVGAGVVGVSLSTPHGLYGVTQYDDGVYFGAALRLAAGAMPYRDFTFVQPPGIALLMAPVALLAHLLGTGGALAAARVVTAIVAGANALGAAWLVRGRGLAASAVAGLSLALFPPAFFADHTLLLEPYVVGACLLGANLVFRAGAVARDGRVLAAGLAFGLAESVKLWAVVPFACLALCLWASGVRRLLRFVAGAGAAFVAICLPFLAAAPSAFVHDVFIAQFARQTTSPRQPAVRLWGIVGLHGLSLHFTRVAHGRWAYALGAILLGVVILGLVVPLVLRRAGTLDAYLLASTLGSVGLLFVPVEYFDHYTYFSAGFLAPALGAAIGRGANAALATARARGAWPRNVVGLLLGALVVGGLLGGWRTFVDESAYDRSSLAQDGVDTAAIAAVVPVGACVVSDSASLTIEADRFYSTKAGCPDVVDADGTWLALDPTEPEGTDTPSDAALVADWRSWFGTADDVVLRAPYSFRIPWSPALRHTFAAEFERVGPGNVAVYRRR